MTVCGVDNARRMPEPELSAVVGLRIRCDDCGHKSYWPCSRVRDAQRNGFNTIPGLGSKLRCRPCQDRGGSGKNISLYPVSRDTERAQ